MPAPIAKQRARQTSRSTFNRRLRWQEQGPAKELGGLEPAHISELTGVPPKKNGAEDAENGGAQI